MPLLLKGARHIIITYVEKQYVEGSYSDVYPGYMVQEDDRYADGLTFDEMLGQVVELMHPQIGKPHYRMLTAAEWKARSERQKQAAFSPEGSEDCPL